MSDHKNDEDLDDNALAALVGPSAAVGDQEAPAGDDDDDVLDLRALAASMVPPTLDEDHADDTDDADSDDGEGTSVAPPARKKSSSKRASSKKGASKKSSSKKSSSKKGSNKRASSKGAAASSEDRPRSSRPPAPVPTAASKGNNMWMGIAIGALAMAAAAFFMNRGADAPRTSEIASGPPTSITASAQEPAMPTAAEEIPTEELPDVEADVEPAVTPEGPAELINTEPAVEAAAQPAAAPARPRGTRRAPSAATMNAPTPAEPATTPPEPRAERPAEATMAAAAAPAGGLDDVLNQALGGRPAAGGTRTVAAMRAAPAPAPTGDLPATPSRGDVARTLGRLMAQIRQCAGDQVGLANATIMVRSDGTPASVAIGGHPFGGTPQGACMEGVLRRAQFPPFSQTTFRVNYPFAIRAAN